VDNPLRRVLIIEDSPDDALLLLRKLQEGGFHPQVHRVETRAELTQALEEGDWDLILADHHLPGFSGTEALQMVRDVDPDIPFLLISGTVDEETAVEAMRAGAQDFLAKDRLARLLPAIERELRDAAIRRNRRSVVASLVATRSRLEHLLSSSPAVLYSMETNPPFLTTFVGPNIYPLFGLDPDRFIEDPHFWRSRLHPDDRDRVLGDLAGQVEAGWGIREYRFLDGHGDWRWVQDEFQLHDGTPSGPGEVTGYFIDITTRKRSDAARRQSEDRYRTLFHQSRDAIGVFSMDGEALEFNEPLFRLLGSDVAGPVGLSLRERFLDPQDWAQIQGLMQEGSVQDHPIRLRSAEGQAIDALLSTIPWASDEQEMEGVIVILRDVTRQQQTERELKESEAKLRQVAEHVDVAFWISSVEKDEILYVSPAYDRIWGRPGGELHQDGLAWLDAIHPEDRDRVRAALPGQPEGDFDVEYRVVRPDGQIRWVRDRAFPVRDAEGQAHRLVGVAEDITERLELETRLLHSQKMDAVGRLAGGVAHDFNNLLTVIGSHSELLLSDLPQDSELWEDAQEIRRATQQASTLTRRLLAFSKRQVLQPQKIRLEDVVEEMERMTRRLLGVQVELEVHLDERPGRVMADPGQLEQVILNLVVNARDAMEGGGRLIIRTGQVTAPHPDGPQNEGRDRSWRTLSVKDTGQGIPPALQDQIFEPFFTTKDEGTGLGLSTIFGIVEQSGGWIDLDSSRGQGTTFTIHLPQVPGTD
jgi:PAS domain S-box-containing protein